MVGESDGVEPRRQVSQKAAFARRGAISVAIVTMGWALLSNAPASPFHNAPLLLRLMGGAALCLLFSAVAAIVGAAIGAWIDKR